MSDIIRDANLAVDEYRIRYNSDLISQDAEGREVVGQIVEGEKMIGDDIIDKEASTNVSDYTCGRQFANPLYHLTFEISNTGRVIRFDNFMFQDKAANPGDYTKFDKVGMNQMRNHYIAPEALDEAFNNAELAAFTTDLLPIFAAEVADLYTSLEGARKDLSAEDIADLRALLQSGEDIDLETVFETLYDVEGDALKDKLALAALHYDYLEASAYLHDNPITDSMGTEFDLGEPLRAEVEEALAIGGIPSIGAEGAVDYTGMETPTNRTVETYLASHEPLLNEDGLQGFGRTEQPTEEAADVDADGIADFADTDGGYVMQDGVLYLNDDPVQDGEQTIIGPNSVYHTPWPGATAEDVMDGTVNGEGRPWSWIGNPNLSQIARHFTTLLEIIEHIDPEALPENLRGNGGAIHVVQHKGGLWLRDEEGKPLIVNTTGVLGNLGNPKLRVKAPRNHASAPTVGENPLAHFDVFLHTILENLGVTGIQPLSALAEDADAATVTLPEAPVFTKPTETGPYVTVEDLSAYDAMDYSTGEGVKVNRVYIEMGPDGSYTIYQANDDDSRGAPIKASDADDASAPAVFKTYKGYAQWAYNLNPAEANDAVRERVLHDFHLLFGETLVHFTQNGTALLPAAKAELDRLVAFVEENAEEMSGAIITVQGYASQYKGSDQANLGLARKRQTAVADYLNTTSLSTHGVQVNTHIYSDSEMDNQRQPGYADTESFYFPNSAINNYQPPVSITASFPGNDNATGATPNTTPVAPRVAPTSTSTSSNTASSGSAATATSTVNLGANKATVTAVNGKLQIAIARSELGSDINGATSVTNAGWSYSGTNFTRKMTLDADKLIFSSPISASNGAGAINFWVTLDNGKTIQVNYTYDGTLDTVPVTQAP